MLVLAFIQGITEFLPISSSAHLVLPAKLFGWPDQGLAFDTAVHLGSLAAVIFYFRRDLTRLCASIWIHLVQQKPSDDSKFAFFLLLASLPIIPVGFFTRFLIEVEFRGTAVIAFTTIVFGVALFAADYIGKKRHDDRSLGLRSALLIGIAQCLALVPGTSRSGITITTALLCGHTRESAARISFLISIPAIAGAESIKLWDLLNGTAVTDFLSLLSGLLIAAIAAYACIGLFLDYITRIGYLPFVIYRLILGGFLLMFFV